MFFLLLVHPPYFAPPEWSSNAFSLVLQVHQVKLELSKNQLGAQKCKRNSDRLRQHRVPYSMHDRDWQGTYFANISIQSWRLCEMLLEPCWLERMREIVNSENMDAEISTEDSSWNPIPFWWNKSSSSCGESVGVGHGCLLRFLLRLDPADPRSDATSREDSDLESSSSV